MDVAFSAHELRVIGCLIEKQITTPEQYPLSLNALVNACNQKSSRDPVLTLSETDVQQVVDALVKERWVVEKAGFGARVPKYAHRFCNTEFSPLQFDGNELGLLCVLFLRGPQSPGELRTRAQRLSDYSDIQTVESALQRLAQKENGPFVVKLPREPGKRDARYAHLFAAEGIAAPALVAAAAPVPDSGQIATRIAQLEQELDELRREVAMLKSKLSLL